MRQRNFARRDLQSRYVLRRYLSHPAILMKDFHLALLAAYAVVGVELILIVWIRYHFMETPFWKSVVQVVLGGLLVLGVGIAFGSA